MHISDFDYELPPGLIAREPARPRDASRMMVVDRQSGSFVDSSFRSLPDFLRPGDVLVINDTRVLKARMFGVLERRAGTTRNMEVLFVNPVSEDIWEVMCKPGRRIRQGDTVTFGEGVASGVFGEARNHGLRRLLIRGTSVPALLEQLGHIPLPPYLERNDTEADSAEYQTMFAAHPGAIAAPTAGLHFTPEVLEDLSRRGVEVARITLHVGVGTFQPVRADDPAEHRLKPEWFNLPEESAQQLRAAREEGRRIIAVGTTSTRTLEYVVKRHGRFQAATGYADIYILPGHRFDAVDGMLTNFHLPRSTLILLVSALASRDLILRAYAHAVKESYRFYSYGDCMLIL